MDQLDRIARALASRYAVERELGRGGAATVYLARDLRHNRQVAIKVLRPDISSSIGTERFRREIQIAASLNHPHILAVFDSGEVDGLLYYVMPYVDGDTLRDELDRQGVFTVEKAVQITRDIADGLAFAHAKGVIHRDVKPRNILLTAGHALIADFGIAHVLQEATVTELTSDGGIPGTPAYMSPEQAAGHDLDGRSDVYALGCVVYEMLAGEPPYRARSPHGLISQHMLQKPPSLRDKRPDVPLPFADAVMRAMAKSPGDRFDSVTEFLAQLQVSTLEPPATGTGWPRSLQRLSGRAGMALAAVGAVMVFGTIAILAARSEPSWTGAVPETIVVLPHHTAASTAEEKRVAADMAAAVTSEIDAWETVRAVPQVALGGPMFDLGIEGPTLARVDDGLRLARLFEVQGLLAITVRLFGDSSLVEASLFDAATGRSVGRPFRERGLRDSPLHARRIAAQLVGVGDIVGEAPRLPTSNPDALRADAQGQTLLERWRLSEAEVHFREAIARDSGFAMAHHRLAQTLYWQSVTPAGTSPDRSSEITFHSAAALRHAADLSSHDSLHLRAFYAFQSDDYAAARAMYHALIAEDPNDVYALLMLGSTEFLDPWLNSSDLMAARPRANFNTAIRAFAETLHLQPTFELGYGYLFSLYRELIAASDQRACPVFHLPTGERFAPGDATQLRQVRQFCPVRMDSIIWLTREAFDSLGPGVAAAGAEPLFLESIELLKRWVAHSPDQPRPARELARQILVQRQRHSILSPHRIDSLANEALAQTRAALRVSRDTSPADLVRLGVLYLGVDSVERAVALVEQGLARNAAQAGDPNDADLALAANVFVATGQPSKALTYAARRARSRAARNPRDGAVIPYGGGEVIVESLRALGSAQVGGSQLSNELQRLERLWSPPRYTVEQARVLRRDAALRLAPALLLDTASLARWHRETELDDPLWLAMVLTTSDTAAARQALEQSRLRPSPGVGEATQAFLQGAIAARLGQHATAIADFSRIDSIPMALDFLDVAWGLRSTARLLRADSYLALDSTRLALNDLESFIDTWRYADSLAAPLVEYARVRAATLRDRR